jgi:Family of unknown function (DUF6483)
MPNVFLSEDYLIRMINQALAALLAILGLKTSGRYQEAEQLINQTLESLFGLRSGLFLQLDDERLKEMMTYQGVLNLQLMIVVADLVKEEADILVARGDQDGARYFSLRALNFYLEAVLEGQAAVDAELPGKAEGLIRSMESVTLPETTSYLLFQYYQRNGQYREAEAALAEMNAGFGRGDYVKEELREYYTGLLQKTDQELETGGMARDEIQRKLGNLNF